MRKIRRRKAKKNKQIIIISTMCLLFCLCIGYAAFQTNISITAKGNVKVKARVIQAWEKTAETDFHSSFYRESIVSITFLDNNNVPSDATKSWNVSEDQENGAVMAWVVPNSSDNTKYDLYIGAPSGVIANEDSGYIFYNFSEVVSIEFNNNFDTSSVTNMYSMFDCCYMLENLDVSSFDTSNVTNMNYMFATTSLTSLDVSNFDTSNVITMKGMFQDIAQLTELDISNFDTRNVTTMEDMFAVFTITSSSLTTLKLGNLNTSNVTNMSNMFHGLPVSTLDLSSFDTSKVTEMVSMFYGCTSLTELNLCSFDTRNVSDMRSMFYNTSSIKVIYVGSNWSTDIASTYNMFEGSNVLSVTTGQC